MEFVVALFLAFFLCNIDDMPGDDQGAAIFAVLLFFFIYSISFKKKPPPPAPPPPTLDKVRQELEKVLNSSVSPEEKIKAAAALRELNK